MPALWEGGGAVYLGPEIIATQTKAIQETKERVKALFEAKAKPRRAQAEVAAIDGLKAARQNIERMLVDLKTAGDAQAVRAKADIDKAIVTFQASLEDFRRKFTTPSEKK